MVLLRSLPEFSTMCINAIELLGDAMNCKGSLLSSIDCNDSSWFLESRDEVIETQPVKDRSPQEDPSTRCVDLSSHSLESSVHNLLFDSSRRQGSISEPRSQESDIFRIRRSSQEPSSHSLPYNNLNRCTAWIQDDYSFESEKAREECIRDHDSVRIIHWEDRVTDSNFPNLKYDCGIFRPNKMSHGFCSSSKLRRCSAWSVDDSSLIHCNPSVRRQFPLGSDGANIVHWDELVEGRIQ